MKRHGVFCSKPWIWSVVGKWNYLTILFMDRNINYLILFDSLSLFHLWQDRRKKAQDITLKNVTPHLMSRSGYRKIK